jgi:hypothetical protein
MIITHQLSSRQTANQVSYSLSRCQPALESNQPRVSCSYHTIDYWEDWPRARTFLRLVTRARMARHRLFLSGPLLVATQQDIHAFLHVILRGFPRQPHAWCITTQTLCRPLRELLASITLIRPPLKSSKLIASKLNEVGLIWYTHCPNSEETPTRGVHTVLSCCAPVFGDRTGSAFEWHHGAMMSYTVFNLEAGSWRCVYVESNIVYYLAIYIYTHTICLLPLDHF